MLYYVGGFLRDLWLGLEPRDIDVMFHENCTKLIERTFACYSPQKNRFGGMKLNIQGVPMDMWAVERTLYFQAWQSPTDPVPEDRTPLIPCLPNFPKTTFFTVESAVFEVFREQDSLVEGAVRLGWEHGFFDACERKVLDIQVLAMRDRGGNVLCPEFQVVRTYGLQKRLGWILGDNLKRFLQEQLPKTSPCQLAEIYCAHYGFHIDGKKLYAELEELMQR